MIVIKLVLFNSLHDLITFRQLSQVLLLWYFFSYKVSIDYTTLSAGNKTSFLTHSCFPHDKYLCWSILKTKQYFYFFFLFLLSLYSQSTQSDGLQTVYNFDYDDERRAFREELDKYRKENELLRQSLNNYKIHGDTREKFTSPSVGQSIQTASSFDSGLDKTPSGMSSTFVSSNGFQIELRESKERERKLQEQINSLRKVRNRTWFLQFNNMLFIATWLIITAIQWNK